MFPNDLWGQFAICSPIVLLLLNIHFQCPYKSPNVPELIFIRYFCHEI